MPTAAGPQYLGHLGRNAVAQDSRVNFNMDASGEVFRGGFKVSITWTGPSDVVFQDCIDFGKP